MQETEVRVVSPTEMTCRSLAPANIVFRISPGFPSLFLSQLNLGRSTAVCYSIAVHSPICITYRLSILFLHCVLSLSFIAYHNEDLLFGTGGFTRSEQYRGRMAGCGWGPRDGGQELPFR